MADDNKSDLLAACRAALRIPEWCSDYDDEIADCIDTARAELRAGGVSPVRVADDADGRIRLAIKVFVKANFGMDNPDSERFAQAFEAMLTSMKGDVSYNEGDGS